MRIVMPDKLVKTRAYYFKPFQRYVVSDYELDDLLRWAPRTNWKWSSFNAWERRYGGQNLDGKKVCVYRHNAWGDQLIASAVPRYLKTLYPDCTVHLYCHPDVMSLWLGNPFVGGCAVPLPIPFEAAQQYDYHIFYEGMLEGNSEHDQRNCYDDFFGVVGLHDVPPHFKKPCIFPDPEDYECAKKLGIDLKQKYLLYHMSPDNENRRYPPKQSMTFMDLFLEKHKDWKVILVGRDDRYQYAPLMQSMARHGTNFINLLNRTPSFRDLIPFVENANVLVCPDSSVMHLAACFDHVPVVSLWGLFSPMDRIKYYPNIHPIFNEGVCPHAPCRDHNFQLPLENCKDATVHRNKNMIEHCVPLASITPRQILAEVEKLI